jgi:hypothetical protein
MSEHELFPDVDPPSGGWMRLCTRLDAPSRRPRRLALLATLASATAGVLLLAWSLRDREPDVRTPATRSQTGALEALVARAEHPALVAMGFVSCPSEVVNRAPASADGLRVRRVPTRSHEVVYYVIEAPGQAHAARTHGAGDPPR